MILSRRHRHDGLAIGKGHDRQFFTVQKLFNQNLLTSLPKDCVLHAVSNRLFRLLTSRGDHHAFPLREPIRLDDDRHLMLLKIGQRLRNPVKTFRLCGANLGLRHNLF